jgi:hypothetical protein
MPYDEFLRWTTYFEQRPIEWRDDFRTSQVMRVFGDKRAPDQIFPSLSIIFNKKDTSPVKSLKNSRIFQKMLSAKNGDKLQILETL